MSDAKLITGKFIGSAMWNGKQVGPRNKGTTEKPLTQEDGVIYNIPEAEALMFGANVFRPMNAQAAPPQGNAKTSPEIEEAHKVPKDQ